MIKRQEITKELTTRTKKLKDNYIRAYDYYIVEFKTIYPRKTIKGKEQYPYTNESYNLKNFEYIFYNFDTLDIGVPEALDRRDYIIVEDTRINYCKFENCNIKNIIFKNCSFSGSKFKKVNFQNVIFENCIFSTPIMEKNQCSADNTYYVPTIFENCIFGVEFSNCNLGNCLFEKCVFILSKINESTLPNSIFTACAVYDMEIIDSNLCNFAIQNSDILDISFPDNRLTIVDECTVIDWNVKAKKKDKGQIIDSTWKFNSYDEICLKKARTIKNFSRLFGSNGLANYEGEYFYRAKRIELKGLHSIQKFKSLITLYLCGYGERPSFTLVTIIISTIIFGILYMFSGIDAAGDIIQYSLGGSIPIVDIISDYGKCLFFSVTTFSTVGYGNYVPIESVSMILSSVHMILGVSLCALWTGCIFRKIAR